MPTDFKHEGMTVGSSNIPLIRAGFANIIFFLLLIGLILINQVLNDFGINLFIKGIVFFALILATLKVYTHSLSKLFIKEGKALVLVGPYSNTEIALANISNAKIYSIPSSMTIFLKINRKAVFFPSIYFFVATETSFGPFSATKTRLNSLLNELKDVQ